MEVRGENIKGRKRNIKNCAIEKSGRRLIGRKRKRGK